MNKLNQIPRLKKLAESKGVRLEGVNFNGECVSFVYKVKGLLRDYPEVHDYEDVDAGVEEEFRRLKKII
jgi:hypothetical protein